MTRSRALFILAMEQYSVLAYETTQLEIQKLAYFLQEAGEQLRLEFRAKIYGPYAETLNKVLQDMEGHLVTGFDGNRAPGQIINLMAGATVAAREHLHDDTEAQERMRRLSELIEGFEPPYGMELLSSVHWVATHGDAPLRTANEVVSAVRKWSPRKAEIFATEHINTAWSRLIEQGWVEAGV